MPEPTYARGAVRGFPRPPFQDPKRMHRPRRYLGGVEWYTIRLLGWRLTFRLDREDS